MSLSRTVSEINGNFGRKLQIFPSRVFNVPAKGFALKFCNGDGLKNATNRVSKM